MKTKQRTITHLQPVTNLDNPRRKTTTYIPARANPNNILPPETMAQLAPPPSSIEYIAGTPLDRAKGFLLRTVMFGLITGMTMWVVVGNLIEEHPLLSMAAGAYFFGGFLLVFLFAFILDAVLSPSGVALYNAKRFWDTINTHRPPIDN